MFHFTTKAETLQALYGKLAEARVLPQICLTAGEVRNGPGQCIGLLEKASMLGQPLIVRSSARNEDTESGSNAGKFLSVPGVRSEGEIINAVLQAVDAMGADPENQVFIQPFLSQVESCGVAFTADPNTGGNYYILNYDDTGSTSSVTGGYGEHLKTFFHFKESPYAPPAPLERVIALCKELEDLFGCAALDIEFAFAEGMLYLLQVRPLILKKPLADLERQKRSLSLIEKKLQSSMRPHPDLCGEKTVYGVMPDWNPAEMIGIRPRALALSLYKEIITDNIWAYQRDNYGYRNLRSFPLMLDFQGLPYIDARVSFNSFLPKGISEELAEKLAEYYLKQLCEHPEFHDKIEFEIAFTCYAFDLKDRVKILGSFCFTAEERDCLVDALRELTNRIICEDGLLEKDAGKINILQQKHREIMESNLETTEKIYWLLEYCKRYGTLPFAGLARAGFIAVELLRSMVAVGILTEEERAQYMGGLSTVGKNIARDFTSMRPREFLKEYGHLRPGTYDICSPRYDQGRERYFDFSQNCGAGWEEATFKLSLEQLERLQHMLEEHRLKTDVLSLFRFIRQAIEGREYGKFVFTRTLSDILELLAELGGQYGLSREEMSYVTIQRVMETYSRTTDMGQVLRASIQDGQAQERTAGRITLPPLLWEERQIYSFFLPDDSPNFVTQNSCRGEVLELPSEDSLEGRIILIRGADPGYDWIFSHRIAGFITAYGGANSHMAIRAAEFGVPAVIGVGEKQFHRYAAARRLAVDCRNKTVTVL